jgi:hypothetical protein
MKRVVVIVVLMVLCIAALGLYMGWFGVSTSSGDGKSGVTLTVDGDQIRKDKDKAAERIQGGSGPESK